MSGGDLAAVMFGVGGPIWAVFLCEFGRRGPGADLKAVPPRMRLWHTRWFLLPFACGSVVVLGALALRLTADQEFLAVAIAWALVLIVVAKVTGLIASLRVRRQRT